MPRNIRNWWIEIEVDGKKEPIACGPVRADGGFSLTIKQRDQKGIITALTVDGRALGEGSLSLIAANDQAEIAVNTCR